MKEDLGLFGIKYGQRKAMINGIVVDYFCCSENKNAYHDWNVEYIGEGVIYSIDGLKQNSTVRLHFWKEKEA